MEDLFKFIKTKNFQNICDKKNINSFSHAIIVSSPDNFANQNISKLLAMKLICSHDICFSCPDCLKMIKNVHPDMLVYPENGNFSVDDSVNILEKVYIKPMLAQNKVFIINNLDKGTVQSQNKLLKILEEPPQNVFFIINATNKDNILQTIKSRTQNIDLQPFSKEEIISFTDKNAVSEDMYYLSNGWIEKLYELQNNPDFQKNYDLCKSILALNTSKDELKFSTMIAKDKQTFDFCTNCLQEMFRDLLLYKQNKKELVLNKSVNYSIISNDFSNKAVLKIIKLIDEINKNRIFNVQPNMLADKLLIGILEVKHSCK